MSNNISAFIEVAKLSRNKYEWNEEEQCLELDRVLQSAVFYPQNYGFIAKTLCGDGDPLDVLVISNEPLIPGCKVFIEPLCYLEMTDEKGKDEKVLAKIKDDPHFEHIKNMEQIPENLLLEISHFFGTYKLLEKNKWSKIGNWFDTQNTLKFIESCKL